MNVNNICSFFKKDLVVINMGLGIFAENLKMEKVKVLQMAWRPPAGGDKKLSSLLDKLRKGQERST